jgi:hypothetical protein
MINNYMPTKTQTLPPLKQSARMLVIGLLIILTIIVTGEISDAIGVTFGLEQLGLASVVGLIGSLKLLATG